MSLRTIHAPRTMDEGDDKQYAAKPATEDMIEPGHLYTPAEGDVDILVPNGTTGRGGSEYVFRVRRNVFNQEDADNGYINLLSAATSTDNRGIAAGELRYEDLDPKEQKAIDEGRLKITANKQRLVPIYADGTEGKTGRAKSVMSGISGYMDRSPRFPYCRQTIWTMKNRAKFEAAIPYIQQVSDKAREVWPERWNRQKEVCDRTKSEWIIPGTVFTSVSLNKNFVTAIHQDQGDLEDGVGVMTRFKKGLPFTGGNLVFPRYGVAVNWRDTDLLLANVHEFHGNTPIHGLKGSYTRLSCVFYYREHMILCGTPEDEIERAKSGTRKTFDD